MALAQPPTIREPIREGKELLIPDERCLESWGRHLLGPEEGQKQNPSSHGYKLESRWALVAREEVGPQGG